MSVSKCEMRLSLSLPLPFSMLSTLCMVSLSVLVVVAAADADLLDKLKTKFRILETNTGTSADVIDEQLEELVGWAHDTIPDALSPINSEKIKSYQIPKGHGRRSKDNSLEEVPDGVDRRSVILFPGLASTRLRVSQTGTPEEGSKCGSINDVFSGILNSVWVNVPFVTGSTGCWMECISLQAGNYSDFPCASRPDEGLDAISEMAPGLLTGPLSAVWSHIIEDLVMDGHSPHMEVEAVGYDWRLPMHMLEKRDGFFIEVKHILELHVDRRERVMKNFLYSKNVGPSVLDPDGSGVILIAHSMGNVVLRYFFDWLKNELGLYKYQEWIDRHIYMGFFLGAGHLGAAEIMETVIEGLPAGLPLAKSLAREIQTRWGSIPSMFPIGGNASEWDARFTCDKCRMSHSDGGQALLNVTLQNGSVQHYFSDSISDGTAWKELGQVDPLFLRVAGHIKIHRKFAGNNGDEYTDSLQTPWERPPIKRVVCAYGVGRKTPLGYALKENNATGFEIIGKKFEHGNKEYVQSASGFLSDVRADERTITAPTGYIDSKTGKMIYKRSPTSGDGSYPYHSLSWCHNWLMDGEVKVTEVPQDIRKQIDKKNTDKPEKNVDGTLMNTFFDEAHIDSSGREVTTSVWEFDNVEHRGIIVGEEFRRELDLELESIRKTALARLSLHVHSQQKSFKYRCARKICTSFVDSALRSVGQSLDRFRHNRATREALIRPKKDSDCYWNYYQAQCQPSPHCKYKYKFGDYHLGQSCRLATSPRAAHVAVDDLQAKLLEVETGTKLDPNTATESLTEDALEDLMHRPGIDIQDAPPKDDSECMFDIHIAKCVPADFCEYSFRITDKSVHDACHLIEVSADESCNAHDCKN